MSDAILRTRLIRLASEHPEFRKDLLPLIKSAGCEKLPEGGMRENCEKKKEEGAKNEEEKKEASDKTAHRAIALSNPDVMLYMVDPEASALGASKFYEMAIVPSGGESSAKKTKDWTNGMGAGYVLMRRWGSLTDTGTSGRVDSMNDIFGNEAMAYRAMDKLRQEKTAKGYQDVSRSKEYPIGLTRKPSFGWGEQVACRYVPELRELQDLVGSSIRDMGRLNVSVAALARRDSTMGQKLSPMLSQVLGGLQTMDRYLAGQLRECRE